MTGEELAMVERIFTERLDTALKVFAAELIERLNKPQKPWISKQKAYKQYGRANVDRWIEQKTVHCVQRLNRTEINVADLEIQAAKKQLILKR